MYLEKDKSRRWESFNLLLIFYRQFLSHSWWMTELLSLSLSLSNRCWNPVACKQLNRNLAEEVGVPGWSCTSLEFTLARNEKNKNQAKITRAHAEGFHKIHWIQWHCWLSWIKSEQKYSQHSSLHVFDWDKPIVQRKLTFYMRCRE